MDVDFTEIASGSNFDDGGTGDILGAKRIEIYKNIESLKTAQSMYSASVAQVEVDFTASQVVLVTMGTQRRGGYAIAAESVVDFGEYLKLTIVSTVPGSTCMTTSALTHPFQLLQISSLKDLIIEERINLEAC